MGAYLSKPKTDIQVEEGGNGSLSYCCATMQGWRLNQEDAHTVIPDFDNDCSLFGVYDGHGGAEVAQYTSLHFPEYLKKIESWATKETDIIKAFEDAFIGFDDKLRSEEVMKTLNDMANEGKKKILVDDIDQNELDSEKPDLYKDASLPLNMVLGSYGIQSQSLISMLLGRANKRKNEKSAAERLNENLLAEEEEDEEEEEEEEAKEGDSDIPRSSRPTKRSMSPSTSMDSTAKRAKVDDESDSDAKEGASDASGDNNEKPETTDTQEKGVSKAEEQENTSNGTVKVDDSEKADEKEKKDDAEAIEVDDDVVDAPGPSRAGPSRHGLGVKELIKDMDSSSSETDESYNGEEEEPEESEEGEEEADYLSGGETPGDDSGATACVAAVFKDKIVVANAGDSRAVLCRNGEAVDLSYDHKPEDDIEKKRIHKAGGSISNDGRVNGGLNLSRALGDHFYKKNAELELKEQMISALPDVKTEKLTPEDSFLVVACDGIWNSMSSQQVVDFVKERLDNGGELKYICEEICRHCLAPSTEGDGTGCDNITVIIVKLNTPYVPRTDEEVEKTEEVEQNEEKTGEEAKASTA